MAIKAAVPRSSKPSHLIFKETNKKRKKFPARGILFGSQVQVPLPAQSYASILI